MTDASDFLAAIIDRPDDDLPRLVFADFLEEAGEAERAEFIRVQCELARLPPEHEDRLMLGARESLLLDDHRHEWQIPDLRGPQGFRRGFVEVVETAAEWLLAADRPLDRAPIRDLRIANIDDHIDAVIRLPGLNRVEVLNLRANYLGANGRLVRLFTDGPFERLRHLNLQNNRVWPESLGPFVHTPVAARLTTLHLSGNPLADAGLEILAVAPAFTNLRELVFRNDEQSFEDSVHGNGARELADSRTLTKLRVLNLAGHAIGDSGLINLVRSPNVAELVELDVSYNDIGDIGERGIEELVASPYLGRLKRLNLARNTLNRLAVPELLRWSRLRDGVQVDLRDSLTTHADWELIVASEFASQIHVTRPDQE